jgi:predicted DNA-binding transcriptional regulator AlpA
MLATTETPTDVRQPRRYLPLGTISQSTPADFRAKPESLFGTHDVAAAGLVGSRTGLARAINAGKFPRPLRLPSGKLCWKGATIAAWIDSLDQATA